MSKRALFRMTTVSSCTATLAAALLIPALVTGAEAPAARRTAPSQENGKPDGNQTVPVEELETVVVVGEKPIEGELVVIPWMRRLVGQFRIEGFVAPGAESAATTRLNFQGQGLCPGFNPTPAVRCEIHLQLPDAGVLESSMPVDISSLSTASILYGYEVGWTGIRYMLVDRNGIADPQLGELSGDTLTSRARCVNVAEGCQKITRITAQPDGSLVEMQVEIEMGGARVMTYKLSMNRTSALPTSWSPVKGLR